MTDIATSRSASTTDGQTSATETAKQEARDLGHTAVEAGGSVAGTAKDEGRRVAQETGRQARHLYHATRDELRTQAGAQHQRAVGGIRSVGGELRSMADSNEQAGPVGDYARQAAAKIDQVADWLETREPGALITEVKDYARRHPGTFLAGAAVLGLIAGRVTRSVAAEISDDATPSATPSAPTATGTATVPATPLPPTSTAPVPATPVTTAVVTPATTTLPATTSVPGGIGTDPLLPPVTDPLAPPATEPRPYPGEVRP
ncbi:hypothetical protein J2S43_004469 [Catenuloplanes nepalensis]|uniref:Uncharacterized protein n=1 Tax=Catenuloplanes nepalensis TaxID=587533 RepID=A0ABT9MWY7_9ACTN|nr:hypothetical protein [Catenuloplanes nepalensis]MDP9795957.1 hypothetical protein [Catenuloplanes nepalensis]